MYIYVQKVCCCADTGCKSMVEKGCEGRDIFVLQISKALTVDMWKKKLNILPDFITET